MSRMRRDVLLQAQRIPIGDLRGRRTGDIVSHLTADAAVISTGYLHAVSVVFANRCGCRGIWSSCSSSTGGWDSSP